MVKVGLVVAEEGVRIHPSIMKVDPAVIVEPKPVSSQVLVPEFLVQMMSSPEAGIGLVK